MNCEGFHKEAIDLIETVTRGSDKTTETIQDSQCPGEMRDKQFQNRTHSVAVILSRSVYALVENNICLLHNDFVSVETT
jgi:hypothetical protein